MTETRGTAHFTGDPAKAAKCKSCGAAILWVISIKGTSQPLDFEPNEKGNLVVDAKRIVRDGHVVIEDHARRYDELFDFGCDVFMPHHATCPQAAKWRKR